MMIIMTTTTIIIIIMITITTTIMIIIMTTSRSVFQSYPKLKVLHDLHYFTHSFIGVISTTIVICIMLNPTQNYQQDSSTSVIWIIQVIILISCVLIMLHK